MDQNQLAVLLTVIMAILVIVLVCLRVTQRRAEKHPPKVEKETTIKSTGDAKEKKSDGVKKSAVIINVPEDKKIEEEKIKREPTGAPKSGDKEEADYFLRYEPKAGACWVCRLCGVENAFAVRRCGVCGAERMEMR